MPAAPSSGSFCAAEMQHVAEQALGISGIIRRLEPELSASCGILTCRAARDAELSEQYWRDAVRARFPGLVAEAGREAAQAAREPRDILRRSCAVRAVPRSGRVTDPWAGPAPLSSCSRPRQVPPRFASFAAMCYA